MPLTLLDASAVVCTLFCLRLLTLRRERRKRLPPLPPGPKGLPLIGNVFDMPTAEEWVAAQKWGEKYGPVVHIRNLGTSYIFLNTYEAAADLFEKRGSNYSSRPQNTMLELEAWSDWFLPVMPYGDEHRRARQLLHRFLQVGAVDEFNELQMKSTHKMLEGLLETPDKYDELLRHSASETILKASFGYDVKEQNDAYITLAKKGLKDFNDAENFFLVNAFPCLKYLPSWFPGAGFHKKIKEGLKNSMAMYNEPLHLAKESIASLSGTAFPSMASKLLEAIAAGDATVCDEAMVAKVAGITYGAGINTTVSSLHAFFLAMLLYPEVQRRAQEELDAAVGKDILPTHSDRASLPYIDAIIKEIYRWEIVDPLGGVAHTVDEDDEYGGYLIPAGATIYANTWAILKDANNYSEPDKFIPERWLVKGGEALPLDVHKVIFGIGRRVCPGRHFADNSVFIGVASVLSAFNITDALDENGVPIKARAEFSSNWVRHPKPFRCTITPRSDKIVAAIHQAVETAK